MTTQPPPQQQQQVNTALAIAAAAAMAGAAVPAAVLAVLWLRFLAAGIDQDVLAEAIHVVMSLPPERTGVSGSATATVSRLNHIRNAQFLVAAARRLQSDVTTARSRGTSRLAALADGVRRERRYYGQHLVANWTRANAAAQVDSASGDYGNLLGWNTVLDAATSAECRAANRHNFLASEMPRIGYPGAVHPHCRCYPGPPFPGAPLVGSPRIRQPSYAGAA